MIERIQAQVTQPHLSILAPNLIVLVHRKRFSFSRPQFHHQKMGIVIASTNRISLRPTWG
jgi:hypothetical protein